jgi:hypothetical protein
MSEWWSYSLADFLLFSPRVYYRLFETLNTTWWLAVSAALVAGMITFGLSIRHGNRGNRVALVLLAMIWGWVSAGFLWYYYQPINWLIPYSIPAFITEALLMVMFAARRMPLRFGWQCLLAGWIRRTVSPAGHCLMLARITSARQAGECQPRQRTRQANH